MKNKIKMKYSLLSLLMVTVFLSCTDLEIEETDSLIPDVAGDTDGFTPLTDPTSALGDLYNTFGGHLANQESMYALAQVTSDELVVPTRGTDWGDNGVWRQLHTHTWRADHLFIQNCWNELNQNIFRATEIIESSPTDEVMGEAKFLRALNMFFVLDYYGVVPFREIDEGPSANPKVLTRVEAYNFVEEDLLDALDILPAGSTGTANTGKATKATVNFLLAKLYLNSFVYDGSGTPDDATMQKVIDNVDAIKASGFDIETSGYFQIFEPSDDLETIFFFNGGIGNRIWNGLHYNHNTPDNEGGGWNGFSTLSDFYDSFEGDADSNYMGDGQEERRGWVPDEATANETTNFGIGYGFLIGQQYDSDGTELENRQGQPLAFTKEIPALVGNSEQAGIRIIKYHPFDPTDTDVDEETPLVDSFRPHQILFRYADAHLMKAEAMMRMGGDATTLINELRSNRTNTPALTSVTMDDILAERGRELYIEYWRRNDLVRFNKFTSPWQLKEVSGDDNKNLFPIPGQALLSNPNLVQNPGY